MLPRIYRFQRVGLCHVIVLLLPNLHAVVCLSFGTLRKARATSESNAR